MINDLPLVDVHLHAPRLSTIKPSWDVWVGFGRNEEVRSLYGDDAIDPQRFAEHLSAEGVDRALLLAEYSPKVTFVQPFEDAVAIAAAVPDLFAVIGNVNPHFHHPCAAAAVAQIDAGAVAIKVHGVHGGFDPGTAALYPTYAVCEERGVPVVVHAGTSIFPGSINRFGDPSLLDEVCATFPDLTVVLAHGGRGWWYEQAAAMVRMHPNVYIDIAGLPPQRLPDYYGQAGLDRLAERFIFGSDWPAVPGIRHNVEKVCQLGLSESTVRRVLYQNASKVYGIEVGK